MAFGLNLHPSWCRLTKHFKNNGPGRRRRGLEISGCSGSRFISATAATPRQRKATCGRKARTASASPGSRATTGRARRSPAVPIPRSRSRRRAAPLPSTLALHDARPPRADASGYSGAGLNALGAAIACGKPPSKAPAEGSASNAKLRALYAIPEAGIR